MLNAGGISHCLETVEGLIELEHTRYLGARKEGLYFGPYGQEQLSEGIEIHISEKLLATGIGPEWFTESWDFGNGCTRSNISANYQTQDVVIDRGLTEEEILARGEILDRSTSRLQRIHRWSKSWDDYEARWIGGQCPHYNHVVHLTWLLTKDMHLAGYGYNRTRAIIEEGAIPVNLHEYDQEPGRHFSTIRPYVHNGGRVSP